MRKLAKSIAIMIVRFHPIDSKFYSALEISSALQQLPLGNHSSLFADVDSIKMGLMYTPIRKALATLFPLSLDFIESYGADSIIKKGDNSFKRGYQIKWLLPLSVLSSESKSLQDLIAELADKIFEECQEGKAVVLPTHNFVTPLTPVTLDALDQEKNDLESSDVDEIIKDYIYKGAMDKRKANLKRLQASVRYQKSKRKSSLYNK